jgi:hypothetical protein
MIRDPHVLATLSAKLSTVTKLGHTTGYGWNVLGGGMALTTVPLHHNNLALVLAYEALEDALQCLRNGGVFACASWKLGILMQQSQSKLQWLDYVTVDEGRDKRNKLAHEGQLLDDAECRRFVSAVGAQLRAWGVP